MCYGVCSKWPISDNLAVLGNICLFSQEEKRKMKEEIERRRAEAAEKRQKVEDNVDGEERPFKCVSPRGSSLKVGPEFLHLATVQCVSGNIN